MRGGAEEVADAQRYPARPYPAGEVSDARRYPAGEVSDALGGGTLKTK